MITLCICGERRHVQIIELVSTNWSSDSPLLGRASCLDFAKKVQDGDRTSSAHASAKVVVACREKIHPRNSDGLQLIIWSGVITLCSPAQSESCQSRLRRKGSTDCLLECHVQSAQQSGIEIRYSPVISDLNTTENVNIYISKRVLDQRSIYFFSFCTKQKIFSTSWRSQGRKLPY